MPTNIFNNIKKARVIPIAKIVVFISAVFFISQLAMAENGRNLQSSNNTNLSNGVSTNTENIKFIFTSPSNNAELKGIVNIQGEVENDTKVEFYLKPAVSLSAPIYLGKGISDNNVWHYSWDTTKSPNGVYTIVAKVQNSSHSYAGGSVEVIVNNEVVLGIINEEENKKKETELNIKKKEAKENIINKTEELTYQVKEITNSEAGEKIETETKQKLSEAEKHTTQAVENYTNEVKKEKQLQENLDEQKQQEEQMETKIKSIEGELEAINKNKKTTEEIKALETAKKNDIKVYQEGKEKIQNSLNNSQKELEKVQEKKEEIKKEIIKKNIAPVEVVEKAVAEKDKAQVLEVKNEIQKKTEQELVKIELEAIKKTEKKKEPPKDFVVERIEVTSLPQGDKGLKIEGKGRPNSFINVYIFSNPIVMTTKTDENGSWSIILDKPLSDGAHEVYTVLADNPDEATARSNSFSFTKAGDKVAAITVSSLSEAAAKSPIDFIVGNGYLIVILIVILSAVIAFMAISISSRNKVS